jgi:hypothetical protein
MHNRERLSSSVITLIVRMDINSPIVLAKSHAEGNTLSKTTILNVI